MILIVDDDKAKKSLDIKKSLDELGIPSVICDIDHIKKYPEALAVFSFVQSENRLNIISVRCGKTPVLAVNESRSRIYNKDVLFYDSKEHSSHTEFILNFLNEKYSIIPNHQRLGNLVLTPDGVSYGVAKFKLTKTERKILNLLLICRNNWVSEYCITHSCFEKTGKGHSTKVPVHICNLNKKAHQATGRNFILAKRGAGYKPDPYL